MPCTLTAKHYCQSTFPFLHRELFLFATRLLRCLLAINQSVGFAVQDLGIQQVVVVPVDCLQTLYDLRGFVECLAGFVGYFS